MTGTKPLPSLDFLRECFDLSEKSPSGLVWKVRPSHHFPTSNGWKIFNARFSGKQSGSIWFDKKRNRKYFIVEI